GIGQEEGKKKNGKKKGGPSHGIQFWIICRKPKKMPRPGYQTILAADIPAIDLEDGAGRLRVIAGSFQGRRGPARTFTPIELYDLQLKAGKDLSLTLPAEDNTAVFVLQGRASANGSQAAGEAELIVLKRNGSQVTIEAKEDSRFLIISGKPIEEPIARYGPFVMNTKAELIEAVQDYQA